MLIYFLSSGGFHPYGNEECDIEWGIMYGTPRLETLCGDLRDLLLWTLNPNPVERPVITEILQ